MKKHGVKKLKIKSQRRFGKKAARALIQEVDLFGEPVTDVYFEPRTVMRDPGSWGKYSRFGE